MTNYCFSEIKEPQPHSLYRAVAIGIESSWLILAGLMFIVGVISFFSKR